MKAELSDYQTRGNEARMHAAMPKSGPTRRGGSRAP